MKAAMAVTWEQEGRVRYRVTIKNSRSNKVNNIDVKVNIPQKSKILSFDGPFKPKLNKSNVEWSVDSFEPQEVELFEFVVDTGVSYPVEVAPSSLEVSWVSDDSNTISFKNVCVGEYVGGKNNAIHLYHIPKGGAAYSDTGIDLGVLRGSWYEMGNQYGIRVGPIIAEFFDIAFEKALEKFPEQQIIEDIKRYEISARAFAPEAVKFIEGIADSASVFFEISNYADAMSDYYKVMFLNIEYCIMFGTPGDEARFPLASHGCTAMAVEPSATADGSCIFTHNCDVPFSPYAHRVTYIAIPDDPTYNAFWTATEPGKLNFTAINSKGVASTILSGPRDKSWIPNQGVFERSFGVAWPFIVFTQMIKANNLKDAIDIVTIGTPEYRAVTGRVSLQRARQNSWLLADDKNVAVVEATANRYAIRKPGDHGEEGFVVVANHFVADHSYDEDNNLTGVPMSWFGDEESKPRSKIEMVHLVLGSQK